MAACITGLRETPTRLEVLVSHAISVAIKLVASYACRGAFFSESTRKSMYEQAREEAIKNGVPDDIAESIGRGVVDALCSSYTPQGRRDSEQQQCTGVFVGRGSQGQGQGEGASANVAREIGKVVQTAHVAMALSVALLSQKVCVDQNVIVFLLEKALPPESWFANLTESTCEQMVVHAGFALIPRMLDIANEYLYMRAPAMPAPHGVSATLAPTELGACAPGAPCARDVSGESGTNKNKGAGIGAAIAILVTLDNPYVNASLRSLLGALANYVCENKPKSGSERGKLRAIIIDTIARILSEGCKQLPEQIQSATPHGERSL